MKWEIWCVCKTFVFNLTVSITGPKNICWGPLSGSFVYISLEVGFKWGNACGLRGCSSHPSALKTLHSHCYFITCISDNLPHLEISLRCLAWQNAKGKCVFCLRAYGSVEADHIFFFAGYMKSLNSVSKKKKLYVLQTHQDRASETLQQIQQLPPIPQVREHVFDGRLPRLRGENSTTSKFGFMICFWLTQPKGVCGCSLGVALQMLLKQVLNKDAYPVLNVLYIFIAVNICNEPCM